MVVNFVDIGGIVDHHCLKAVTHVILGERIEKDISLLSSATFR
jgi:hypothetical protein